MRWSRSSHHVLYIHIFKIFFILIFVQNCENIILLYFLGHTDTVDSVYMKVLTIRTTVLRALPVPAYLAVVTGSTVRWHCVLPSLLLPVS